MEQDLDESEKTSESRSSSESEDAGESNEESEEEQNGRRKKLKTENWMLDSDDQTEYIEVAPYETTEFEAYDFKELAATNLKRMKMESQANSGQGDSGDDLPQASSTASNANLKFVFDEEYRAPE